MSVTLLPTVVDVLDAASVVVVEVVLEELVEELEPEPQPVFERRMSATKLNAANHCTARVFLMHLPHVL